jgi:2-haloacid dehalogenase
MSERRESLPRAVVFDVGRVLYEWDIRHLYAKLIEDAAQLDWFLAHVVTEAWHGQHDAGLPIRAMIAQRCEEFPEQADLIRLYYPRWLETVPGPIAGSHAIVRALSARGIPLFAITNFGADTWTMFRPGESVFDLFADIVVSGFEKLVKPDPAIFELAAGRFGHSPGEMLFIDDNHANIASAAALGWQVHHFSDAATLARDPRMIALLAR